MKKLPKKNELQLYLSGTLGDEYIDKYYGKGNFPYHIIIQQFTVSAKSKGFGDTIAKLTNKVGIKPCGGCKSRQAKLNNIFPYKD